MIAALLALPIWAMALIALSFFGLFALIEFEKPGWATATVVGVLAVVHFGTEVDVIQFIAQNPFQSLLLALGYFAVGAGWSVGKWWFFVRRLRDKYDAQKVEFLKEHRVTGETIPERLKEAFLRTVCWDVYTEVRRRFVEDHPKYVAAMQGGLDPSSDQAGFDAALRANAEGQGLEVDAVRAWYNTFVRGRHSRRQDPLILSSELPTELKEEFRALLAGPEFKAALVPSPRDHKARIMIWMAWWPWSMLWTLLNDPIKRLFRAIYRALLTRLQKISERAFRRVDDDLVVASTETVES